MTCSSDPESVFASLASSRALSAKFSVRVSMYVCVCACVRACEPCLCWAYGITHATLQIPSSVSDRGRDYKHSWAETQSERWTSALTHIFLLLLLFFPPTKFNSRDRNGKSSPSSPLSLQAVVSNLFTFPPLCLSQRLLADLALTWPRKTEKNRKKLQHSHRICRPNHSLLFVL